MCRYAGNVTVGSRCGGGRGAVNNSAANCNVHSKSNVEPAIQDAKAIRVLTPIDMRCWKPKPNWHDGKDLRECAESRPNMLLRHLPTGATVPAAPARVVEIPWERQPLPMYGSYARQRD